MSVEIVKIALNGKLHILNETAIDPKLMCGRPANAQALWMITEQNKKTGENRPMSLQTALKSPDLCKCCREEWDMHLYHLGIRKNG